MPVIVYCEMRDCIHNKQCAHFDTHLFYCNVDVLNIKNRDRGSVPYKVINPKCETYEKIQRCNKAKL